MPTRPRATAPRSPFAGKTLGRCLIGRPIGRGATATVFHAEYLPLKRDVAVKILRSDAASPEDARRGFVEEARALAKLDHENVVRVFDVVEDQGFLLIIMDFVPGRSLREAIEEDGPVDPETAIGYTRQIAQALDHAHGARILHRDVKPGNVIVRDDGVAVLVDFGNAEGIEEATGKKGTAHYVAPEVFQGKRQDEKTDTYSLGATLYHMLAGEPPYKGQSVQAILAAHEAGKVRAPSLVNPEGGIPKELDALVKRAMAPARGYRFAAREFVEALDGVLPVVQGVPRRVRARKARARGGTVVGRKSPAAMVLLGLVCLAALAIGLWAATRPGEAPPEGPKPPAPGPGGEKAPEPAATAPAHPGPGIEKRAETRQAREEAAGKALREAYDFVSANLGRPGEIAARFQAVADEYADLESGRKAREEAKIWADKALTFREREDREAARREAAEREKKAAEEALQRSAEAVAAMRFAEALAALQDQEPPAGKAAAWKRRLERLNALIGFPALLDEALQGTSVSPYDLRAGWGKPGERIVGAAEEGLRLKSTSGDRVLPWKETKPAEVVALCRKVFRNSPEPRLVLAAFCWESGLPGDARKEVETALLTDRTGTFGPRIDELFGDEVER